MSPNRIPVSISIGHVLVCYLQVFCNVKRLFSQQQLDIELGYTRLIFPTVCVMLTGVVPKPPAWLSCSCSFSFRFPFLFMRIATVLLRIFLSIRHFLNSFQI